MAPLRLTLGRPHDDRPARGVKARRALRWRVMVAFHKDFRVSSTVADEITFRNKIPETLKPARLCNPIYFLAPFRPPFRLIVVYPAWRRLLSDLCINIVNCFSNCRDSLFSDRYGRKPI